MQQMWLRGDDFLSLIFKLKEFTDGFAYRLFLVLVSPGSNEGIVDVCENTFIVCCAVRGYCRLKNQVLQLQFSLCFPALGDIKRGEGDPL